MSPRAHPAATAAAALAIGALIASLAFPRALPAQARSGSALRFALGIAAAPTEGLYDWVGAMLGFGLDRPLLGRLSARLDAEFQFLGAGRSAVYYLSAPCPVLGCPPYTGPRAGTTVSASALASVQLFEEADQRGFYLVAGLGPQFLLAHPDRSLGVRLAGQAGLGVALGSVVLLEIRYQGTLGARAEPRHVVLFTLGLRHIRPSPARG